MKILIIEDDRSLRDMLAVTIGTRLEPKFRLAGGDSFPRLTRCFVGTHTLLLAASLDEARGLIGEADAVLCDGNFPISSRGAGIAGGLGENWPFVLEIAERRGIPFALLSGDARLVERTTTQFTLAKLEGAAAFAKPMQGSAAIEWILDQIAIAQARFDQNATAA